MGKYIFRLLALVPLGIITFIGLFKNMGNILYLWMKNGGEFVAYKQKDQLLMNSEVVDWLIDEFERKNISKNKNKTTSKISYRYLLNRIDTLQEGDEYYSFLEDEWCPVIESTGNLYIHKDLPAVRRKINKAK